MKVSVIIPNYNHARFLDERIQSVLNQEFDDLEVILLDDASTDESVEVLQKYSGHAKVKHLVINDKNSGSTFRQWQKGIELASGDWIWIAESDDVADFTFLKRLTGAIHENVGVVYCRSRTIDVDGEPVKGNYFWPEVLDERKWKSDFVSKGIHELSTSLLYLNIIPNASSAIFKKSLVGDLSKVMGMRFAGDWLFWSSLLQTADLVFINEPFNAFRKHSGTTRALKSKSLEIQRFIEYAAVIRHNLEVTKSNRRLKGITWDKRKYRWIFEELAQRRKLIGFRNTYFPPIPRAMWIAYWKYLLKRK